MSKKKSKKDTPATPVAEEETYLSIIKISGGGRAIEVEAYCTPRQAEGMIVRLWNQCVPSERGKVGFAAEGGAYIDRRYSQPANNMRPDRLLDVE